VKYAASFNPNSTVPGVAVNCGGLQSFDLHRWQVVRPPEKSDRGRMLPRLVVVALLTYWVFLI
jgi:hypothetical protein